MLNPSNGATPAAPHAKTADNGVDIDAILEARKALEAEPEGGQFTWRATCAWVDGVHSRSSVDGYFGLGAEQRHRQPFTIEADHPEIFAASDKGATPAEVALAALASCLMAGVGSVAQHRGIQLRSVKATVEGDMDLAGILGIDPEVRNGFSAIRVRFEVDADATAEEKRALIAQAQKRSAVFDVITNPTHVHVTMD